MATRLTEDTIEQVIKEMTLEEKVRLTTGGLPYGTAAIERFGIPNALTKDSMAGMNFRQLFADYCSMETGEGILESLRRCEKILRQLRESHRIHPEELNEFELVAYEAIKKHLNGDLEQIYNATSFPAGILLGATWNPEVVNRCANALARELDAFGVDVLMSPNVNIQRDPLGGRLFESYSEDPYLTGELGLEFVKGVQEVGILADPKHFAANNHEKERKGINVHVCERALREIYFPGFEACVRRGKAKTVMSAYNKLNGTACSANRWLLTDLLRKEWGFDGIVISDWGGVYHSGDALHAGNDLEMPRRADERAFVEDLRAGRIAMEDLDRSVRRILRALLDMPCMKGHRYSVIDKEYSEKAAYDAVCEGIVLLKNDGILPHKKDAVVNLRGEGVRQLLECGGGSAEVLRGKSKSLLEWMRETGGENVLEDAGADDVASEYVIVAGRSKGREGADRDAMLLEPEDQKYVTETLRQAKAAGKKTILVLNVAGPVDVRAYEDNADAILCVFIPGCQGARALSDILYGNVNPSGKLAITFPDKYEDCPTFGNFPGYNWEVWYGEGIYVGYRYYDTKLVEPKYPFGHGLSYTSFEIHDLKTNNPVFEGEPVRVSVDVTNTGAAYGKEVVQLYMHHDRPTLQKPYKELKAFAKIGLEPGETRTVCFELKWEKFASYDEKLKRFAVEPGTYTLLAGDSSRNIQAKARVVLKGADPYGYNEETRFATLWSDARCVEIYKRYFEEKCGSDMYNDLLGYTPDYPSGKAFRERIPQSRYDSAEEKDAQIKAFFAELAGLDLGK